MRNQILGWGLAIAVSVLPLPAHDQSSGTLDDQTRALKVIGDAAERICSSVSTSGSSQNVELSGEAKAELAGVIKNVAELGIKGAGKYESADYNNVLQKDLAAIIKQNTNCRQTVFQA